MNRFKVLLASSLAAAAVVIAGCNDQGLPTGPPEVSEVEASPQYVSKIRFASGPRFDGSSWGGSGGWGSSNDGWGSSNEKAIKWSGGHQKNEYEVRGYIGSAGGTLSIAKADFTITFPAGALSKTTRIEITAEDGNYVEYDMEPHGITFNKPVTVVQGLQNTEAYYNAVLAGNLVGAYVLDNGDPAPDGSINATELLTSETFFLIGSDGVWIPQFQTWEIDHFSRYMLASG